MGRCCTWVLAFLVSFSLALGQEETAKKPCSTDEHKAFDFWVGVWDVSTKDGQHVGENEITSHGCMLFEDWRGDRGSHGVSLNFIDAADGMWTQDWVDNSGGRILIKGGFKDGAMRLVGEHTLPNGTKRPFRGTWTPLEDGRVRQHFEEIAEKEAGWATWFDGYYARRVSN
jgi:hypothetical protein